MRKGSLSIWVALGITIGAALGTAASFLVPAQYESTAELQVVPSQVPERFVGGLSAPPIPQALKPIVMVLLSRGMLAGVIQTYDLYPLERRRLPMEDIILTMREDVRVWTQTESQHTTIHVSFRYRDRVLAQKVASYLAERLVDEFYRSQKSYQQMTVQFLRDMRDAASRDWLTLKQGRGAAVDHSELRPFELDAARRRNESVRQKLGEAEILDALVMRRMAETLEVSDPASLPEKAISPRRDTFMAGGAFVGLLSGLLVAFARRQGSRNSPAPEANS